MSNHSNWCEWGCHEEIAKVKAKALRDAADELARLGHRSAVTRLREWADRLDGGVA